jgi:hypothetical protein
VALGVAGADIAFPLQEVIASVAGWAAVALARLLQGRRSGAARRNPRDELAVGVLRTTIMKCGEWVNGTLYNGRIARVPNSFVFRQPVFDYSSDSPFLWDEITVSVRHGSDHRLARQILESLVRAEIVEYAETAKAVWSEFDAVADSGRRVALPSARSEIAAVLELRVRLADASGSARHAP